MPIGRTAQETEFDLNMARSTVSARCSELRPAGYTDYWYREDGKRHTRLTSTTSPAYVQICTQLGFDMLDNDLPLSRLKPGRDPTRRKHGGVATSDTAFGRTDRMRDARRILKHIAKYTPRDLVKFPEKKKDKDYGLFGELSKE